MAKIYFQEDGEHGRLISWHLDYMRENGIPEMKVYEGEPEYDTDHFYCKEYFEVGLKSEGSCGKICEGYAPRNGKSGRCKHSTHCYDITDRVKVLRLTDQEIAQIK